jgi:DNA-binding HxlR family transcriptional regulator
MRSYRQYCALAKALDVIGDRWSLLIVRELLLRDGCRYTDLRDGLPGIATNLLAERLRELERLGVIEREDAPPPVATTLFRLTDRGRELRPAVHALGRWGAPLLGEDSGDDAFRGHWLALPLEIRLEDRIPEGRPMTIGLRTGEQALVVELADGALRIRAWTADTPDVTLTGSPRLMLGVLTGSLQLEQARARGLEAEGDVDTLRRVLGEAAGEQKVATASAGA